MQVEILKENLHKAVSVAARFTGSRSNLPILSNLLLSAKKGDFTIAATNLEISIQASLGANVIQEGVTTIQARTLQEYLSSLGAGKVSLLLENQKLNIKTEVSQASMVTALPEEFPKFPVLKDQSLLKLKKDVLKKLIQKTVFAAATDEGRPVLTGVLLRLRANQVVFVSTDGFRLSEAGFPLEKTAKLPEADLIVPATALQELERLLSEEGVEEVSLLASKNENQIGFTAGNFTLITRLLEAQYPDYQKIIPTAHTLEALLDQESLLQAVKSAAIFAGTDSQTVKLAFDSNQNNVLVSGQSASLGESETRVPSDLKGKSQTLAFNARFLKEGISSLEGPQIVIKVKEPVAPSIFSTLNQANYQHVIMPIRLNQEST